MTKTFGATADTNDLYLNADGNLAVLDGLPAVVAACRSAALAQLGEMVLAQKAGIPNFQTIWVGKPNYAIFESYLRRTLQNVPGVTEVKEITLAKNGHVLNYTATIQTAFGSGIVNG